MKTFKEFVILFDESLSSARKLFKGDHLYFEELASLDHTPTKKYLEWIVKQDASGNKVSKELILRFDKISKHPKLSKKDINLYKSPEELESAIKEIERLVVGRKSHTRFSGIEQGKDYEIAFESPEWTVYKPLNFKASRKIGSGTEWCTVANKESWIDHKKTWLYYCIPNEGKRKLAVCVGDMELLIFNMEDKPVASLPEGIPSSVFQSKTDKEKLEAAVEGSLINNDDGTFDVKGDVDLSHMNFEKIPIRFRKVSGNFWCSSNHLITLEGAPQEVGGDFRCDYNNLTSLKGAPQEVSGKFTCNKNVLVSLDGAPTYVGGDFACLDNKKKFTKTMVKAICDVKGEIYT